ncbi:MAG: CBS domain-containing protein [Desulfobacteraceae bacterium]|nr:MAG: CBS domain-containing protein [Desulfobacteraceae bacterium]
MNPENTRHRLAKVTISPEATIAEALDVLDKGGIGILLLCDETGKIVGVLTDGNIRRAIMNNISLDSSCLSIATANPLTAPVGTDAAKALHLMNHARDFLVNHLPIVDSQGKAVDLLLRGDLLHEEGIQLQAVVMAGGFGKRLHPLTEDMPKPMLPIGERPIMEHIIDKLKSSGIKNINVTTHFMANKIKDYFGDGRDFGVEIEYVSEDKPLGTAGALGLMDAPDLPVLVINGDIMTNVDFRAMLDYHREHKADLTVGARAYDVSIPYGVIECDGVIIKTIREKPTQKFLVNAGIYLLSPVVYNHIPKDEHYDMTDLIEKLISKKYRVITFPIMEYWIDIGRHADYDKARSDLLNGRIKT